MAAKKAVPKKEANGKRNKKAEEGSEPLSEFQDTSKTGRGEADPVPKPKLAITIEKVKIEKDDALSINFSKVSPAGSSYHADQFEQRMHPDLRRKFSDFRIHLALLCDYISTQQVKDLNKYNPELVEKFHVSSISIKEEGVVITGHKITKSGKAVILNTPFTLFEADSQNSYRYAEELANLVQEFSEEVLQYLDGSKKGEDPQQSLSFPEQEESFAEEAR